MKTVFFGTPDFVLPVLNAVGKNVVAVVTQKPRPVGRKQILKYSPVDTWAHKRKIPIFFSSKEFLESGIKADLGILEAYGEILGTDILNFFPHKILNIHPSLLPRWRGASPVQATILSGDSHAGATTIILDEKLDHGPIISQFKEEILPDDTAGSLRTRLFERSAQALTQLLPSYLKGKIIAKAQDDKEATFTTKIVKEDGFIPPKYLDGKFDKNWEIKFIKNYSLVPSGFVLDLFIKAMNPWPVAWTFIDIGTRKRMKIIKAHIKKGELVLDEVQLEGKNSVAWEEFKRGYPNAKFAKD